MTEKNSSYNESMPPIIIKNNPLIYVFLATTVILVLILLGIFSKYSKTAKQLEKLTVTENVEPTMTESEVKKVVEKVSKHILLPDELPKVVTVTNVETLKKEQAFFENAKDGQQLLIYPNKVIIYDPNADKVIDIAYIKTTPTGQEEQEQPTETVATPTPTKVKIVTVALYNGTDKAGLTSTAESQIESKFKNMDVVLRDSAQKNDYAKTLVVDMSGSNSELAKNLATEFGADQGKLPEWENPPKTDSGSSVDILVIVGRDYIK